MQTYVVRIYRPDSGSEKGVLGIVEIVHSGQKRRFASLEELSSILDQSILPRQRRANRNR